MKKGCLLGCVALPIIAIAVGTYLYVSARTAPQVGEDFAALSPQQKNERRAAARKLESEVRDIARSARNKEGKAFTLVVDEGQLNTLLQDRIDTKKFPIRDLRAGMQPDEVTMQGRIAVESFDTTATMSGNIVVKDGELHYDVISLKLEGVPAGSLRKKAQKQINRALEKWRSQIPGRITNVKIERGHMTVEGQTE